MLKAIPVTFWKASLIITFPSELVNPDESGLIEISYDRVASAKTGVLSRTIILAIKKKKILKSS